MLELEPERGTQRWLGTLGSARPSPKRDTMALGTLQPGLRELQALVASPKRGQEGLGSLREARGEEEQWHRGDPRGAAVC